MEMSSEIILRKCSVESIDHYLQAVQRWHTSPHFVNRRISTSITLFTAIVQYPESSYELMKLIVQTKLSSSMDATEIINSLKICGVHFQPDCVHGNGHHLCFTVKKLLPRSCKVFKEMLQITISDSIQNEFIFVGLPYSDDVSSPLYPTHPFSLKYVNGEMLLMVFSIKSSKDKSAVWLQDCLFPKLQHWTEELSVKSSSVIQSLSLIPADQYSVLYQRLKERYAQKIIEIWPERTDPQKFVFEDVAIATYLLLLWDAQRTSEGRSEWRQSFVDMGCGNGLLVYILNSEGFPGIGIDVRKRGIWDLYPCTTVLKVQTFVPSNCALFPETDWMIGNHSDELTPWIPVIASRSSYSCSFFLLPCCAYNFNGKKYQRKDSSRSQYSEYLDYVKNICDNCGFITKIDRLKIPSTKRICLVSSGREYPQNDFEWKQKEIMEYVQGCTEIPNDKSPDEDKKQSSSTQVTQVSEWTGHFVPRESKEEVRNCTQLEKSIISTIIDQVVKCLLAEEYRISFVNEEGEEKLWNAGVSIPLDKIASFIPLNLLSELKNQCGGLQTLLKNNHHIFLVTKGCVKLNVPGKTDETVVKNKSKPRKTLQLKVKQRPCWFYHFHPDGCPLRNEECTFRH